MIFFQKKQFFRGLEESFIYLLGAFKERKMLNR